jgi:hypothetical protein
MTRSIAVRRFAQDAVDPAKGDGLIDLEPLVEGGRNWTKWAGPLISFLILAAVAYQLRHLDRHSLMALLPSNPLFWAAFLASYLVSPVIEWVIFRRLWSLPPSGFAALLRKLVSNEILLGYLGEVYFYAWARRNAQITTAPFGDQGCHDPQRLHRQSVHAGDGRPVGAAAPLCTCGSIRSPSSARRSSFWAPRPPPCCCAAGSSRSRAANSGSSRARIVSGLSYPRSLPPLPGICCFPA